MAARRDGLPKTAGASEDGATIGETFGHSGKDRSPTIMNQPDNDETGRLPLAYRNRKFLDTPDARALRILSEYLYPLSHFRKEKIHDTIVFFGSARTFESGLNGRYYNEARELARRITAWSDGLEHTNRRFVVCSGGGPGIMEAANR